MAVYKILKIFPYDPALVKLLSKKIGISELLARLLINRGIKDPKAAESFLETKVEDLLDPNSFTDMDKAIALIRKSAKNKEKVLIFGDYDVDGITSVALIKTVFTGMGIDHLHYIPHRVKEGYGLNKNIFHIVKESGVKLIVTADCGINNSEEIRELRRLNTEVIITDHHEQLDRGLLQASATINPKAKNSGYKYRDLAGVGVAFKFCQAVSGKKLLTELDLVCMGTIADVVPLTGENRIIVKEGLRLIPGTKRLGLKALMDSSRLKSNKISTTSVSYIIGPRINASGRIDTAETALKLLLTDNAVDAKSLAEAIEQNNRLRQKIEAKIMEEANMIIESEINFKDHKVIVIAKEGWHHGVLGIVASKLVDKFYRPVVIISLGEDLCKGSGRSIKNFHLFDMLTLCGEHLKEFGGHKHAAGLVIKRDQVENFKKKLNHLAKEKLRIEDLLPTLEVDAEVFLSDLDEKAVLELKKLEPFGADNPEPLLYAKNLTLKSEPQILARDTLKFWVSDGKISCEAIGFGKAGLKESLTRAKSFDLAFSPKIDDWNGDNRLVLEIEEIFFK
ncbi:MAG: single-stranded-DNA-specific exonuclease RecJ [Candidatus Omnitrophota bacterium]